MRPTSTMTNVAGKMQFLLPWPTLSQKETQRSKPASLDGSIINLINKKDSIRKKLKQRASSLLREKFRTLGSEIKRRLRECREAIFVDMESILKSNPKRFWSVLRVKSKPKTSLKRLPWQPVATQESRRPLQAKLRNYSTSILRQYFASVQGTPRPWKGEWSVTGLRPVLDWCNSLSIWSCYWTRLVTCKNFERNNWRNSTLAHRIVQQVAEVGLSARGLETCKHRSCFQKI